MKKLLLIISLFIFTHNFFALPFNTNLSKEDLQKVENGEVVINSINKFKNIALNSDNPGAKKLVKMITDLNPNYLAEIIQVRPVTGNENITQKLVDVLKDVYGYVGIPYWSVQHKCYFDLYGNAYVHEITNPDENTTFINAILEIGPFGFTYTPIIIEQTEDYMLYSIKNDNALTHKGITCVKKGNMLSLVLLFKEGDNWILYGAGCVKAPKMPLFEQRIETSFINRTKTFCQYVFSKI